ncbi:MAG: hypothetical protein CL762_01850 [Chloroflexi bacterium]|nr:hypothetical protein [Chloroflexota bacterium]|tara:strand:+ start:391 stop:1215 length:825 start_codon:yes stop_codon:yes gene_type:complete
MNDSMHFIFQDDLVITEIKGNDFIDLFNRLSTNNISDQSNLVTDSIFTNENGRFIDVVSIWNISQSSYMVSNSFNHDDLLNWIDKYTFEEDISISKPLKKKVISIFSKNEDINLNIFGEIKENVIVNKKIEDVELILARSSFFNGHKIINLILNNDSRSIQSIKSFLNSQNIYEMEENEFNSFRIRNMIPICGKEIINSYNPLEIGMSHLIDFDKGCYIGQEVIARLDTYDKIQRKLLMLDNEKDSIMISSKGCDVTSLDDAYCLAVVKKSILN